MIITDRFNGLRFVALTVATVIGLAADPCCAQERSTVDTLFAAAPARSAAARVATRPAYVDANTRWAFQTISPVTIHSPIVRLGDVVRPLDPDMAGWQRLRQSPIGLVPLGGAVMTINRDRLGQAITSAEATARTIEWIGAEQIEVHYRPGDHATRSSTHTAVSPTTHVRTASHTTTSVPDRSPSNLPPADPVILNRLVYWIDLAIKRHYPAAYEAHEIIIDRHQTSLRELRPVTGIDHIEISGVSTSDDVISDGQHSSIVTGRSVDGPVRSVVVIRLRAHPLAITVKGSVRRGHRFQSQDLNTIPIPRQDWDERFVADVTELIGMEALTTIRANQPIVRDSFGPPILVRRNDRVEIRVLGGGISVTTNGKALEEGSESELIEVETMKPRKRLICRVAGPGLVEILTRPPRVQE